MDFNLSREGKAFLITVQCTSVLGLTGYSKRFSLFYISQAVSRSINLHFVVLNRLRMIQIIIKSTPYTTDFVAG